MKLTSFVRSFAFAALLGSTITMMVSCKDDDENQAGNTLGTITGKVTSEETNDPIEGVTVTVSGGTGGTATTDSDGKYTVANVSIETHSVAFSKTGWALATITVAASKFNADGVATINATLKNASAKITGRVLDGEHSNAALEGVTVSVGAAGSATSSETGEYTIENLAIEDYTVTFTKEGYPSTTLDVARTTFVDGVATLEDVVMGGAELLRGKTATDLANADKWYYNEYRGGGNAEAYPHWDWACDYMCALDFVGAWAEQWEGTTLQIRNDADAGEQSNPADLEVFDSYVYGSKKITNDNKMLTVSVRTHGSAANPTPTIFGVQVVDLSSAAPAAVKIGQNVEYDSDDYTHFDFDLSEYVGKEVVIAIGTYRAETGDYWRQLVLRRIAFAPQKMEGWSWQSGTDPAGLEGWALPMEVVRSTMPHTKKSFTGRSPYTASRNVHMTDGYPFAYRSWRDIAHIGFEWSFVPLAKDPEPTPNEGYIIKTNGNVGVNTTVPQAYFYAKFAIAAGNNQLTLKGRNFGSNYTYFKLTAIKEDGTVTHLEPASNTAEDASAAENGCWKFKHGSGSADDPESYASFVYDLSQLNGNNVVLCLGVFKGGTDTNENKLAIYSIDLQ
jgi:hypothetical protein